MSDLTSWEWGIIGTLIGLLLTGGSDAYIDTSNTPRWGTRGTKRGARAFKEWTSLLLLTILSIGIAHSDEKPYERTAFIAYQCWAWLWLLGAALDPVVLEWVPIESDILSLIFACAVVGTAIGSAVVYGEELGGFSQWGVCVFAVVVESVQVASELSRTRNSI